MVVEYLGAEHLGGPCEAQQLPGGTVADDEAPGHVGKRDRIRRGLDDGAIDGLAGAPRLLCQAARR